MKEEKLECGWNISSWLSWRMVKLMGLGCRLSMAYKSLDTQKEIPHDEAALDELYNNIQDAVKNLPPENSNQDQDQDQRFFARFKDYVISNEDELMGALDYVRDCDIKEQESLQELGMWCFILAYLYNDCQAEVKKNGTNDQDDEATTTLLKIDEGITEKSYEALGYWSRKSEIKISAARIQGAMSKEIGDLSVKEAEKILEKFGGIVGYSALGYGQKKPLTDEIAQKLKLKDKRHVYNILKKIKAKLPND